MFSVFFVYVYLFVSVFVFFFVCLLTFFSLCLVFVLFFSSSLFVSAIGIGGEVSPKTGLSLVHKC